MQWNTNFTRSCTIVITSIYGPRFKIFVRHNTKWVMYSVWLMTSFFRYFTFLTECKDPKACTILLRGASKDVLNEVSLDGFSKSGKVGKRLTVSSLDRKLKLGLPSFGAPWNHQANEIRIIYLTNRRIFRGCWPRLDLEWLGRPWIISNGFVKCLGLQKIVLSSSSATWLSQELKYCRSVAPWLSITWTPFPKVERNLQDAMNVARNVLKDPRLVPGGGACEMALAHVSVLCSLVPKARQFCQGREREGTTPVRLCPMQSGAQGSTVLSGEGAGGDDSCETVSNAVCWGNLKLITLGSERVNPSSFIRRGCLNGPQYLYYV